MANRERSAAKERYWRDVLERHTASGLRARAFCRREKLAESAFYAWRRTIAERDAKRPRPTKASPAFVPAVVTSEPRRENSITIELAGGRVLRLPEAISAGRLPEAISAGRLAEVVEALEARAVAARILVAEAVR
jgi:hypothetical protein